MAWEHFKHSKSSRCQGCSVWGLGKGRRRRWGSLWGGQSPVPSPVQLVEHQELIVPCSAKPRAFSSHLSHLINVREFPELRASENAGEGTGSAQQGSGSSRIWDPAGLGIQQDLGASRIWEPAEFGIHQNSGSSRVWDPAGFRMFPVDAALGRGSHGCAPHSLAKGVPGQTNSAPPADSHTQHTQTTKPPLPSRQSSVIKKNKSRTHFFFSPFCPIALHLPITPITAPPSPPHLPRLLFQVISPISPPAGSSNSAPGKGERVHPALCPLGDMEPLTAHIFILHNGNSSDERLSSECKLLLMNSSPGSLTGR